MVVGPLFWAGGGGPSWQEHMAEQNYSPQGQK
jgi:hypothetical protein